MKKNAVIIGLCLFIAALVGMGATWNADKPAVGNQISADIPDIEENFQELHDVTEAITNGTLGTTTASAFRVDAVTSPAMWVERAKFQYKDADEIYINPGAYHHNGTVAQVVYWSSQLTSDIGSPDASDWYYLYIDDSAVVTAGTNLLTTDELVWSNTEPTYTVAKHGWYNGLDRCIFAVYSKSNSEIHEFYHDGGNYVDLSSAWAVRAAADLDTTLTAVDFSSYCPNFSTRVKAEINLEVKSADGSVQVGYRPTDSSATSKTIIGLERIGTDQLLVTTIDLMLNTSQSVDMATSRAGADTVGVNMLGFYLPAGM